MRGQRPGRLVRICHEIKVNPNRTPKELYEILGVSKQQFYKDKASLEESGFKFNYSNKTKSFVIEQDSFINTYDLTLDEVFALAMSVRHLSSIGDYNLTHDALGGIRKIINQSPLETRGVLQGSLNDLVFRKGFGCDPKVIDALNGAIKDDIRRVVITYDNFQRGGIVKYEFDPYTIFPQKNGLYVEGYSPSHKTHRKFRINRIKDVHFTQFTVQKRSDYSFKERHKDSFGVFTGEETTKVKIRFSKRAAKYIQEPPWESRGKITRFTNGNILYEVDTSYPKEVLWWVLGWGADAEIVEPEWLRGEVVETVRGMAGVYSRKENKK